MERSKEITFVECLACGKGEINTAPFSPYQMFISGETDPEKSQLAQDTKLGL